MSPAQVPDGSDRGTIILIGGAEEKVHDAEILRRFVKFCGSDRARMVIIPTASETRDKGQRYESVFKSVGVRSVRSLPFETRSDCERDDWLKVLREADGVFLTGGNQLRLSTTLGGTSAAKLLRRLNADGVPMAGTSAGAAFLPEHMIALGEEGSTPRGDMVTLAPGLGLTNRVIVDQHFRQRDRLGRLLTALAYNPFAIGVGLDEDTAAFIAPDNQLEVVGSGALTIVDPSAVEHSSMDSARKSYPVCLIGVRLHILVDGATFNLETREAVPATAASRR